MTNNRIEQAGTRPWAAQKRHWRSLAMALVALGLPLAASGQTTLTNASWAGPYSIGYQQYQYYTINVPSKTYWFQVTLDPVVSSNYDTDLYMNPPAGSWPASGVSSTWSSTPGGTARNQITLQTPPYPFPALGSYKIAAYGFGSGSGQYYIVAQHYQDFTNPTGSISLTSSALTNGNSATFNISASDSGGAGLWGMRPLYWPPGGSAYLVAASDVLSSSGSFTFSNMTTDGTYWFRINVWDNVDNIANSTDVTVVRDTVRPTASFAAVTSPRSGSISSLGVTFSESVTGVGISDFTLTRDGSPVPLTGATVTGSGSSYTINNLSSLTSAGGTYVLTAVASGSGIADAATNQMNTNATRSWVLDNVIPTGEFAELTSPRRTAPSTLGLFFSESVTGVNLADFSLTRNGSAVTLTGVSVTGSGQNYTLTGLGALAATEGSYELRLTAAGSGIVDSVSNALTANTTRPWTMDLTAPNSAASIDDSETNNAAIPVDFLALDSVQAGSTRLWVKTPASGSFVDSTLTLFGPLGTFMYTAAAGDGIYEFYTVATDAAGNAEAAPSSSDAQIRVDLTPPTAGIVAISPDPRAVPVGNVSIGFPENVTGFDLSDLSLTRDGSPVSLAGTSLVGSGASYSINLASVTEPDGNYTFTVNAAAAGISDSVGNLMQVPASDSWLMNASPAVATISDVTPDPRGNAAGTLTVTFDEPVTGVDIADFTLLLDEAPVDISSLSVSGSGTTYTIDVTSVTFTEGLYELRLNAAGSGILNNAGVHIAQSASEIWLRQSPGPTAIVAPVTPDPRNTAVGPVSITFSRQVEGVDVADFVLYRDNVPVSITGVTISGSGANYTLDLTAATGVSGHYDLVLVAGTSGIIDRVRLVPMFGDVTESWDSDLTPPTMAIAAVEPNPRNQPVTASITMSEPVTGLNESDFSLTFNGAPVAIPAGTLAGSGASYTLDLSTVTTGTGDYILTFNPTGSGVVDTLLNPIEASASAAWTADYINPIIAFSTVTPSPRNSPVGAVTLTFSENVTGFDAADLSLTRSGTPIDVTDLVISGGPAVYTIDLAAKTTETGNYILRLNAVGSGILDPVSNPILVSPQRTWIQDYQPPTADIVDVTPDYKPMNAGVVRINFSEAVTGVDVADFSLTRNAAPVSLAGVNVSGSGTAYTIDLTTVTAQDGNYVLNLNASGSGILDGSTNPMVASATDSFEVRRTVTINGFVFAPKNFTYSGSTSYTFTTPVEINNRAYYVSSGSLSASGSTVSGNGKFLIENVSAQGNLQLFDGAYSFNTSSRTITANSPASNGLVISGVPMGVCSAVLNGSTDARINGWFALSPLQNNAVQGIRVTTGSGTRAVSFFSDASFRTSSGSACSPNGFNFTTIGGTFGTSNIVLNSLDTTVSGDGTGLTISNLTLDSSPLTSSASGSFSTSYGTWSFYNQAFGTNSTGITLGAVNMSAAGVPIVANGFALSSAGQATASSVSNFSFGGSSVTSGSPTFEGNRLLLGNSSIASSRSNALSLEVRSSGITPLSPIYVSGIWINFSSPSWSGGTFRGNSAQVYGGNTLGTIPAGTLTLNSSSASLSSLGFSFAGFPISIPASANSSDWSAGVRLTGPSLIGSPSFDLGNRRLSSSGLDLNIDKCLTDLLPGGNLGFSLRELCIKFQQGPPEIVAGRMSMEKRWAISPMSFNGAFAMKDRQLTKFEFDARNLNKPIGTTGAELDLIRGAMLGLSGSSPYFQGYAELENTGPANIWDAYVNARVDRGGIKADGSLFVLNNRVGDGELTTRWDSGFYTRVKGWYKVAVTRHTGSMQVERPNGGSTSYAGSYSSSFVVPKSVPLFGGMSFEGLTAGVGGRDTSFWISVSKCMTFVPEICFPRVCIPFLGCTPRGCTPAVKGCLGVKITSSGNVSFTTKEQRRRGLQAWERELNPKYLAIGDELVPLDNFTKETYPTDAPVLSFLDNIRPVEKTYAKGANNPKGTTYSQAVNIPAYRAMVIRLTYELETGNPEFTLTAPNSFIHTFANSPVADNPANGVIAMQNPTLHEATFLIGTSLAGTYTVEVLHPQTLGTFAIEVLEMTPGPAIDIHQVALVGDQLVIEYTADAPTAPAEVSLFVDNNSSGADGAVLTLPAPLIINGPTTNTLTIDVTPLIIPPGRRYIYAVIDDGQAPPVTSYSPGYFYMPDPLAPPNVTGFDVAQAGTNAVVQWDAPAVPDPAITSWNLYWTDDPENGEPSYGGSFGPTVTNGVFPGFRTNTTYKFLLTATREYVITVSTKSALLKTLHSAAEKIAAEKLTAKSTKEAQDRARAIVAAEFSTKALNDVALNLDVATDQALKVAELNIVDSPIMSPAFRKAMTRARLAQALHKDGTTTATLASESEFTAFEVVHFGPIAGINNAPIISSAAPNSVVIGDSLAYQIEATDIDGDPITFHLMSGPSGLTMTPGGLVQWTPTAASTDFDEVVVEVRDNQGGITVHDFLMMAVTLPPPPTLAINSTPETDLPADVAFTYQPTVSTIPGGSTPNFTLLQFPAGMTISASTGLINWTAPSSQGNFNVELLVQQEAAGTVWMALQTFTLEVASPPDQVELPPSGVDPGIITVAPTSGDTVVRETLSDDSYTITLDTVPTDSVVVVATPPATLDLGGGPGLPVFINFGPDAVPGVQIVVPVEAISDGVNTPIVNASITHQVLTTDPAYQFAILPNIAVTIEDENTSVRDWNTLD